jgi:ketosteroid isomerase-like protein
MREDLIAANLRTVDAHFHSEATNEVDKALELFTDDIIWESPTRNLVFSGKAATGDNYRKMFSSFEVEGFRNLERFATEKRVVDDSIITAVLIGDGVANAPVPIGSKVEIRLLHIFDMRDGKISRELVFENWQVIEPAPVEFPMDVRRSLGGPLIQVH